MTREYARGQDWIREPDGLLAEGTVVDTHKHKYPHNTDLTMGLWDVFVYAPQVNHNGVEMFDAEDKPLLYLKESYRVEGGGPNHTIYIPARYHHRFVLLKGFGFYRCRFCHRRPDGTICETPMDMGAYC